MTITKENLSNKIRNKQKKSKIKMIHKAKSYRYSRLAKLDVNRTIKPFQMVIHVNSAIILVVVRRIKIGLTLMSVNFS